MYWVHPFYRQHYNFPTFAYTDKLKQVEVCSVKITMQAAINNDLTVNSQQDKNEAQST